MPFNLTTEQINKEDIVRNKESVKKIPPASLSRIEPCFRNLAWWHNSQKFAGNLHHKRHKKKAKCHNI